MSSTTSRSEEIRGTSLCAIRVLCVVSSFPSPSISQSRLRFAIGQLFTLGWAQSRKIHTITGRECRWGNRRTTSPLSAPGTSSTPWTATFSVCWRRCSPQRWSDCCPRPLCCSYLYPCAAQYPLAAASRPRERPAVKVVSVVPAPIPRAAHNRIPPWNRPRRRWTHRRRNRFRNRTTFPLSSRKENR